MAEELVWWIHLNAFKVSVSSFSQNPPSIFFQMPLEEEGENSKLLPCDVFNEGRVRSARPVEGAKSEYASISCWEEAEKKYFWC